MRYLMTFLAIGVLIVLAYAEGPPGWDIEAARNAVKFEIQVDESGKHTELEIHIPPEAVPQAVRDAMDQLHPGGPFTGAEMEWEGEAIFYELTREVGGFDVEAMFSPEGELHSAEIAVAESSVPQAVRDAIAAKYAGCAVNQWEEIRDGDQQLVEYHVKLTKDGKNHKVTVTTAGEVTAAFLEIPAEVEVPVPVPE
ncbi:MAG: PepSY-like domain-containing protein [Planctomycetota bacterium]|jgi:hypothetical protein